MPVSANVTVEPYCGRPAERHHSGSSTASDFTRQVSADSTEFIPTRSATVGPRVSANPMKFVATGPAPLYRSASEQLQKVEKVRQAIKAPLKEEEPAEWQNNLDNWKSSRRKRQETVIERLTEVKRMEEMDQGTRRRSKTFDEMMQDRNEKGRGGGRLLQIYTDDNNDIGPLLSSKSPTSSDTRSDLGFSTGSDTGSEPSDHQDGEDGVGVAVLSGCADECPSGASSCASVRPAGVVAPTSPASHDDSGTEECTYDSAIRGYIRFAEKTCAVRSASAAAATSATDDDQQQMALSSMAMAHDQEQLAAVRRPGSRERAVGLLQRRSMFEVSAPLDGRQRGGALKPVGGVASGLRQRIASLETVASAGGGVPTDAARGVTAPRDGNFRQKLAMFSSMDAGLDSAAASASILTGATAESADDVEDRQLSAADLRSRFERLASAASLDDAEEQRRHVSESRNRRQRRATTSSSLPSSTTDSIRSPDSGLSASPDPVQDGPDTMPWKSLSSSILKVPDHFSSNTQKLADTGGPSSLSTMSAVGVSSTLTPAAPCAAPPVVASHSVARCDVLASQSATALANHAPADVWQDPDDIVDKMEAQILQQLEDDERARVMGEDPSMIIDFLGTTSSAPPSEKPPPPPSNIDGSDELQRPSTSNVDSEDTSKLRSSASVREDLLRRKFDFLGIQEPTKSEPPVAARSSDLDAFLRRERDEAERERRRQTAEEQRQMSLKLADEEAEARAEEWSRRRRQQEQEQERLQKQQEQVEAEPVAEEAAVEEQGDDGGIDWQRRREECLVDDELDRQEREIIEGLEREETWRIKQQAKYKSRLARMPPADAGWTQSQQCLPSAAAAAPSMQQSRSIPNLLDSAATCIKPAARPAMPQQQLRPGSCLQQPTALQSRTASAPQERRSNQQHASVPAHRPSQPPPQPPQSVQQAPQPVQYTTQPVQYATQPVQHAAQSVQHAAQSSQYHSQAVQHAAQPPKHAAQHAPQPSQPVQHAPLQQQHMSQQTLHALSAAPRSCLRQDWQQQQQPRRRNDLASGRSTSQHWLIQEAEHRRISEHRERGSKQKSATMPYQSESRTNQHPAYYNHAAAAAKGLPAGHQQSLPAGNEPTNQRPVYYHSRISSLPAQESANQQPAYYQTTPHLPSQPTGQQHPSYYDQSQPIYENTPAQINARTALEQNALRPHAGGQGDVDSSGSQTNSQDDRMLSVSGRKKCSHCAMELGRGAAMIIESLRLFYHIGCFKCCVCSVQLGNGSMGADVRVRNNKLHCHDCYSNDDGLKFSKV